MREEMTGQLRAALDAAQTEARAMNQDFVGAEHLMLGLLAAGPLAPGDSEAIRILRRANVGIDDLRRAVVQSLPRGNEPPVVTGNLPLSPRAKRAVNSALASAQARHDSRVSTRLLVKALLEEPESAVRSALRGCGADIDQLERFVDDPVEQAES